MSLVIALALAVVQPAPEVEVRIDPASSNLILTYRSQPVTIAVSRKNGEVIHAISWEEYYRLADEAEAAKHECAGPATRMLPISPEHCVAPCVRNGHI